MHRRIVAVTFEADFVFVLNIGDRGAGGVHAGLFAEVATHRGRGNNGVIHRVRLMAVSAADIIRNRVGKIHIALGVMHVVFRQLRRDVGSGAGVGQTPVTFQTGVAHGDAGEQVRTTGR